MRILLRLIKKKTKPNNEIIETIYKQTGKTFIAIFIIQNISSLSLFLVVFSRLFL